MLRARDRERAATMGVDSPLSHSYYVDGVSSPAEQIHGLLEASGVVDLTHSIGPTRGRLTVNGLNGMNANGVGIDMSTVSHESWSPSVSAANLSRNTSLASRSGNGGGSASRSYEQGSIGTGTMVAVSVDGMGEEESSSSLHHEGRDTPFEDGQLTPHQPNGRTTPYAGRDTPVNPPTTVVLAATAATQPPPRPRKSSIRSTLPSIKGFRNPFSFSRSASVSSGGKERGKSKERSGTLPAGVGSDSNLHLMSTSNTTNLLSSSSINLNSTSNLNLNSTSNVNLASASGSNINLTMPSIMNGQRSPISPVFGLATLPRGSVDLLSQSQSQPQLQPPPQSQTSQPIHSRHESIGSTTRFGFSKSHGRGTSQSQSQTGATLNIDGDGTGAVNGGGGGSVRHSIDSPAGFSRIGSIFRSSSTGSGSTTTGRAAVQVGYVSGSRDVFSPPTPTFGVQQSQQQQQYYQQQHPQPPPRHRGPNLSPSPPPINLPRTPIGYNGIAGVGSSALVRSMTVGRGTLPPHLEMDEVSMTTRTESGYGFGGIRIGGDGLIIEGEPPVGRGDSVAASDGNGDDDYLREEDEDDLSDVREYAEDLGEYDDDVRTEGDDVHHQEEEVSGLLGSGTFEGEYESTEGHGTVRITASDEGYQEMMDAYPHSHAPSNALSLSHGEPQPTQRSLARVHKREDSIRHSGDHHPIQIEVGDTLNEHRDETPNQYQPDAQRVMSPVETVPYPYPVVFSNGEDEDTSGELESVARTAPVENEGPTALDESRPPMNQDESIRSSHVQHDPSAERDLLNELAKHLQRVVKQQSMASIARVEAGLRNAHPLPRTDRAHTPSSVLQLENGGSGLTSRIEEGQDDNVDEWGRWNIDDLKGAVERMKEMIDEQEKRMKKSRPGHGGSGGSKASLSSAWTGMTLSPEMVDNSSLGPSSQQHPSGNGSLQITPMQYTRSLPSDGEQAGTRDANANGVHTERKESQSSSSVTATSTTVVTPITPNDGQAIPWPSNHGVMPLPSDQHHKRSDTFDLDSLDPDLLAMLSPNHLQSSEGGYSFIYPE
jgi:hypothetical protein